MTVNRGGVDDTTFEAEDSKKSVVENRLFEKRPSRGWGMVEAKVKDTIFLTMVGKFSIIFKPISVKDIAFC